MKKILKFIAFILILGIIAIQFINRPDKSTISEVSNDDITKKVAVPADVQTILKRSCYDCHSSQTVWPWYSNIAPVSWLVADDVVKGRQKMNFNTWGKLSPTKQEKKFSDIVDEITEGAMPLSNYTMIHKDAVLSEADKQLLLKWANEQKDKFESGQ